MTGRKGAEKGARNIGRLAQLSYELCLVNVFVDVLASTRDSAGTRLLVQFETHLSEILVSLGQDAVVVAVLVNLVAEGQPGTEVHRLVTGSAIPGIEQRTQGERGCEFGGRDPPCAREVSWILREQTDVS